MDKYTYVISSADNLENGVVVANHCVLVNILFLNLPSNVKFFKCRVKSFIINPASFDQALVDGRYVNLLSPNFIYSQSNMSGNRSNQIIAYTELTTGLNNHVDNHFLVQNPNGRTITFQLYDEFYIPLSYARLNQNTYNTTWYLTLEFTPIDAC